MRLSITPLDTVFFRDGKAFTMGEESQADGLFPPPPSVVRGALRTRYFTEHPDQLAAAGNPNHDPTYDTSIKGMALHDKGSGETFFPLPRDLVRPQEEDDAYSVVPSVPVSTDAGLSGSSAVSLPLTHPDTVEGLKQAWIGDLDLEDYLYEREETYRAIPQPELVSTEPKIGVMMNRQTRGAKEGHLYRVGFRRLRKDISFAVQVEGLSLSSSGLLKLGGEAKPSHYRKMDADWPVPAAPAEDLEQNGALKLYLSTPALFDNGWLPSWIDPDTHQGTLGDCTLRLQSAAVGKPQVVGGWDMKNRRPKPMRKAVPAGSVYFFAVESGPVQDALSCLHATSCSDHWSKDGFGIGYVGVTHTV